MPKEIFVIGIGGTGMRCIESFVHLCAIGMFDETDVHLLALDTDKNNGNFTRLKNLKEAYQKTKGINKSHQSLKNTFFSANLHYYEFSPDYSRENSFESIYKYGDVKYANADEAAIADLLFTDDVKTFDLKHGYRAQTHLGSMLMYHSIIDEVKKGRNSGLKKFIENLVTNSSRGNPRIFILGSVFGGTGASSIPIIPRAIKEAAAVVSTATDIEKNAYFGSTLLTSYFSFKTPTDVEVRSQKIIASSDKFALNSQAALMFYEADETVKKTYQKLYMIGTESMEWKPSKNPDKTETGDSGQENYSHYIELLAAFAAYDFFNTSESNLEEIKLRNRTAVDNYRTEDSEPDYLYRTFNEDGKIEFIDFVGTEKRDEFAKKLGLFTVMSYFTLLENYDFFVQAQSGGLRRFKIVGYEDIDPEEVKFLKEYMSLFHFKFDEDNQKILDGWLRQLHKSAGRGDKFMLNSDLFSPNSQKEFQNFRLNNKIYQSDFESKKYSTGIVGTIFGEFASEFIKSSDPNDVTNKIEKLIKRTYTTLCNLYNF